eukprot:PhM_4_TR10059/c1_g1_i2/m.42568
MVRRALTIGSRIYTTWSHATSSPSTWTGTVVAQHKKYADVAYADAEGNTVGKHRFPPPKTHHITITRLTARKPQRPILPPVGALVGRRIALRFRRDGRKDRWRGSILRGTFSYSSECLVINKVQK